MDREVIEQKLESLRRCLQRIKEKCPPSAEILTRDLDAQDILSLNLSRAVQRCVDIGAHIIAGKNVSPPATMGQTFDVLAELGIISEELADRARNRYQARGRLHRFCPVRSSGTVMKQYRLL